MMSVNDLLFKNFKNILKFGSVEQLMSFVFKWVMNVGWILAVVAIIYSGIMFITAGGDTAKAASAKKNLTWAITGLIIVLLAESIVVWIPQLLENKLK